MTTHSRFSCLLISLLIAFTIRAHASGPALTQISDIVYRADGTPAQGTLTIAWDAFTTADGFAVAKNKIVVTLGPGGALSVQLAPNAGASPSGSFYQVTLHLTGGESSTEYWVVPAASPTTVAAIRSSVMPATIAAQFASVAYVNQAVANASAGSINTLSGIRFADKFSNIQAAIADAGTTGAVLIPSSYAGSDTYTNPNNVPVLDLRNSRLEINDVAIRNGLWRDVRSYGADCTGLRDSRAALASAIQSNAKIVAPPGCKLQILNQPLAITASGWEFDGGALWHDDPGATTIFGCGTGSGPVIQVNRSADWKFHGARVVARGDLSLCGAAHPSTFTKSIEWDNTGSSGQTSTKAEIYNVALSPGASLGVAGVFYPVIQSGKDCGGGNGTTCAPAPSAGNQVGYISVAAGGVPTGIHQETSTTIANGTTYTLALDIAFPTWPGFITFTPSTARVELTANGTVVASTTPSLTQGAWSHVTLNYTGAAATAGQTLGISITNTTSVASGVSEIWFDNVTGANIAGIQNASFESPAEAPAGSVFPVPPNWQFTGGFAYIGLQVGSGTPTAFGNDPNLESGYFHDSSITGADEPGSIGILGAGCCDQSWKLENLKITSLKWGIAGSLGYVATNINASGVGAFSRQGAGGALIATAGCANGVLTLNHVSTTDESGPFMNSMFSGTGNTPVPCANVVMEGDQIGVADVSPSAYIIDSAAFQNLAIIGGSGGSGGNSVPAAGWLGSTYALGSVPTVMNVGWNPDLNPAHVSSALYGAHVNGMSLGSANGLAQAFACADTSTSATAYTCGSIGTFGTFTPARGDMLVLQAINQSNSGAATLNVNGGGAKPIKKLQGTAPLAAGDLQSGGTALLVFDGTNWEMQGQSGNPSSGSGTVTSVALAMPAMFSVSGSPVTASGTLTASLSNQSANAVFAGPSSGAAAAPSFRALVPADIPVIGSAQLAAANTRRVCNITVGSESGAALANADLGPQSRQCFIPAAATIVEITVAADAGTPSVLIARNHAGTQSNLTASALATAASGGVACANASGSGPGIDGATTCSAALTTTSLAAGDWLDLVSGTAGGTARRMSIAVTYTIN